MKKNWNKYYIKGKERIVPPKPIGYTHSHTGGYYSEECGACLIENELADKKSQRKI